MSSKDWMDLKKESVGPGSWDASMGGRHLPSVFKFLPQGNGVKKLCSWLAKGES